MDGDRAKRAQQCGGKQETTVERHLSVTGRLEAVERYVARQGSRAGSGGIGRQMLGDGGRRQPCAARLSRRRVVASRAKRSRGD
jgi:hypothetical protein